MTRPTAMRILVLVVTALLLATLLASLGLRAYGTYRLGEARQRFETVVGPLDPAARTIPAVDPDRNATIPLRRGAAELRLADDEASLVGELASRPAAEWTGQQRDALRRILSAHGQALSTLESASALDGSNYGIPYGNDGPVAIPDLFSLLAAGRLLAAAAKLDVVEGRFEKVGTRIEALGRLGSSLLREPLLVSVGMGQACRELQIATIHEAGVSPRAPPALLKRLRATIEQPTARDRLRRMFAMESFWLFRKTRRPLPADSFPFRRRWEGNRLRDLAAARLLDRVRELAGSLDEPFVAWRIPSDKLAAIAPAFPGDDPAVTIEFYRAAGRDAADRSAARLARLALALRLDAIRLGAYPASLDELVQAGSPDPLTGSALRYSVRADGSASLASPGAGALWAELVPAAAPGELPFTWELPAPAPPPR